MQRSWIKTLLIVVLLLSFAVPSWVDRSASAQAGAYLTANQMVWVYAGPGNGFWILGSLYGGESVPVMGISPDGAWYYVSAAFGEGWVSNYGVVATGTATVGVMDPGPIGLSTGAVNVRYGAGINAQSLGVLARGKHVYVLAQTSDGSWYQIRWEYGTGWVTANYITLSGVTPSVDAGANYEDGARYNDGQGGGVPVTSDVPSVVVLATYLNVRTGPGINYAILGAARGGEVLPVVGRTADSTWYQVTASFGTGWVYSTFVATRNEYGASPVTTAESDAVVSGPLGIVNAGWLNIRSGPGAQYTSIGALAGGAETQIVGRTLDWTWWLLDTPVGTGWANAMYIIVRGDTSTVPHVTPGTVIETGPGQGGGGVTSGQSSGEAPPAVVAGPVAIVVTGALNIRSGPNSTFTSLGAVYAGTRMPIVGQSADRGWWQVDSEVGTGWVSKLYVLTDGSTINVPVTQ
jgi:uncharacterized protein YgiM (DUF1202 family)